MSPSPAASFTPASSPAPAGFPRRTLLAASAVGLGLLVAGCTGSSGNRGDQPSSRQTDALAAQVTAQETLVAAFAAAGAADPGLTAQVADLAAQAAEQLDRLKAASPRAATSASSAASSAGSSSAGPSPTPAAVPAGQDPKSWLRAQVATAADSHAAACLDQTGARAALLGSIAAGLRGQDARLA